MRREIMRTMMIAAAAALSLSAGAAFAGEIEGTQLPSVIAQAPAQNASSIVAAQRGQSGVQADTQPGHGSWLFPPIGKYLDQHAG
jgi:hypothetical protein